MRRLAFAALMILAAAGCYNGEAKPGPNDGGSLDFAITRTIVVDDAGIQPNVARVRVGTAVSVVNRGTKDHDVTSAAIDTGTLHPGESTTVFFTEVSTIDVHDRADPSHTARIEVATSQ